MAAQSSATACDVKVHLRLELNAGMSMRRMHRYLQLQVCSRSATPGSQHSRLHRLTLNWTIQRKAVSRQKMLSNKARGPLHALSHHGNCQQTAFEAFANCWKRNKQTNKQTSEQKRNKQPINQSNKQANQIQTNKRKI